MRATSRQLVLERDGRKRLVRGHSPLGCSRLPCEYTPPPPHQHASSSQVQTVGILCQPAVPDSRKPKDLLDHQKHVFDVGVNLDLDRLRARATSLSGQWRWAFDMVKILAVRRATAPEVQP